MGNKIGVVNGHWFHAPDTCRQAIIIHVRATGIPAGKNVI